MADMPQVTVAGIALAHRERKIDAMALAVFDLVLTALKSPHIGHAPRSDHFEIRRKRLDAELKTDLVISLAGSAVADRDSILDTRDLNQLLRDSGAGHGRAEQISVLIYGSRLNARHDEIIAEFIDNIFYI